MADAADLEIYYASKYLVADGGTLTLRTADAGGSLTTIVDSALTDADDFWNGGIGFFIDTTSTSALQNFFFRIVDFIAATDTLVLSQDLPAVPAAGDQFRLILGGNFRSDTEVPAYTVTGVVNVTGVTVDYGAYANTSGSDGELVFDFAADTLTWEQPGSATPGPTVDVSIDGTFDLFDGEDIDAFLTVTVVAASLPGSNQTDSAVTLTQEADRFLPVFTGDETLAGKTRYHLMVVKNRNATDTLVGVKIFVSDSTPLAANTTASVGIGTGDDTLTAADLTDWPSSGFIRNDTKGDIRYYFNRSGNTVTIDNPAGGIRDFTAVSWDASDVLIFHPEIDVGTDAPSALQFEDPVDEETAPSGVTFSAPVTRAAGLAISDLAPLEIHGIWIREFLAANSRPRSNVLNDITTSFEA